MNIYSVKWRRVTWQKNMQTAHWSAKMFPQADNLCDLAPLGYTFKGEKNERVAFFLTKSKHGKADS